MIDDSTTKSATNVHNPHYEGATPEMVCRALIRHTVPAPQPKGDDQAESEA